MHRFNPNRNTDHQRIQYHLHQRQPRSPITPPFHHSVTPPLHHSVTPPLHHSATPSLRHSTTPPHHSHHPIFDSWATCGNCASADQTGSLERVSVVPRQREMKCSMDEFLNVSATSGERFRNASSHSEASRQMK